jgi:hypothetical protein
MLLAGAVTGARALEVVLKDVAPDRVERQRHFVRKELPLPGTPDLGRLDERLHELGLSKGRAIYVRIFKAESELELWMQNGSGTFTRLAVYPICHWTGSIGPKLKATSRARKASTASGSGKRASLAAGGGPSMSASRTCTTNSSIARAPIS